MEKERKRERVCKRKYQSEFIVIRDPLRESISETLRERELVQTECLLLKQDRGHCMHCMCVCWEIITRESSLIRQ